MPTAYSALPERFADGRHETILRGLQRAGWRIVKGAGTPKDDRDVLVTWTVHQGHKETRASAFEAAGGKVLVCEEGYFRRVGGEKCFALALHDHNGAGRWRTGGPERWAGFGVALRDWRAPGRHIVVTEQRGIGSIRMASPPLWHDDVIRRLGALTSRQIVLRVHPKTRTMRDKVEAQPSLSEHLDGAHALVTWSSCAAVTALAAGVPVYYEAPFFILAGAARKGIARIEEPLRGDRLPAFECLAWAQWRVSEIESGEPFRWLVR